MASLRQAVDAERGDTPSLRGSPAFSRPLAAAGNSTDFLIYGNIRQIAKEILDQLDETGLEQYRDTAAPFVEPLESFLLGVAIEEDIVTFNTVVTFAAPTDAPTPENTPTLEPEALAPTAAPEVMVTPPPVVAVPAIPPPASTVAPVTNETDREALVALYDATDGPNWSNDTNWLSDRPIGEWHGVTTDRSGRVTEIDLSENRLSGTIPSELGRLANLQVLDLRINRLRGEIPSELGDLANLTNLGLSFNRLSGEIPPELGSPPTWNGWNSTPIS